MPRRSGRAASPADRFFVCRSYSVSAMNQHARIDTRPFRSSMWPRSAAGSASAIDDAIARVLNHCQFIMGPEVLEFEAGSPRSAARSYAVSCASGTDALMLVLMAKEHRPGRRGVLPVFHVLRDRRGRGAASARRRCSSTSTPKPSTSMPRA